MALLNELTASHIGLPARQALAAARDAAVWGVTSSGVYLALGARQVLFLSPALYRGPLIINLPGGDLALLGSELRSGLPLRVQNGDVWFDALNAVVRTGAAALWMAPALPALTPDAPEMRQQRLADVYQAVYRARGAEVFNAHFPGLARQAADWRDGGAALAALRPLLGLGPGLTPSGDDLALGFALAASRWGSWLCPWLDQASFGQGLREAAYRQTTTLSANLLECAADGQADERLLLALDSIVCGAPDPAQSAAHLLQWGSSSGANVLLGMALAMGGDFRFMTSAPGLVG